MTSNKPIKTRNRNYVYVSPQKTEIVMKRRSVSNIDSPISIKDDEKSKDTGKGGF